MHADAGTVDAGVLDVRSKFPALYGLNEFYSYERLTICVSSTLISVSGAPNPTLMWPKLSRHQLFHHKLSHHKLTRHKHWLLATGLSPLPTTIGPPTLARTSPLNLQITTSAPAWADGHARSEDALDVAAVTIAAENAR